MRSFVLMLGVDARAAAVRVSAQVAVNERMAREAGGGAEVRDTFRVIHSDAGGVAEALNLLQDSSPLQMYLGHLKVVVLGEEYAKGPGVREIVDSLVRDPEVRGQVLVACARGSAEDLVRASVKGERLPASYVERLINTGQEFGHAPASRLAQFSAQLDTPGAGAVAPVLVLSGDTIDVGGAWVFKGDTAVGEIGHDDLHDLALVSGARSVGTYSVPSPRGRGVLYALLRSPRSRVSVRNTGDRVRIEVRISAEAEVVEDSGHLPGEVVGQSRLGANVEEIGRELSRKVETRVAGLIGKMQREYGVDIFGFVRHSGGLKFEPGRWDELFRTAEVSVKADVRLRKFGMGAA
jgi:spore germination protein KC